MKRTFLTVVSSTNRSPTRTRPSTGRVAPWARQAPGRQMTPVLQKVGGVTRRAN